MRFSLAAGGRLLLVTAALWAAVAVSGQEITRTQIADTLFNADGSRAVGSLRISWKSFTGADGSTVAKNSVDLDIVDGVVSVALAPNLGAVPDGTYYSVEYRLHRGERSNELWIVPASEDPVSISNIRVLSVPSAGMSVSLSQVNGLPAVLDAKADKAATNTFTAPQFVREDAPETSSPLLGLQKHDGEAGVYFRLPELSGDVTYTLPPNGGSPNQALTTDGSGVLFWASTAGGGAGSGSAYELLQQGGTSVTQRAVANFTSGFLVSDNGGQLRTDITPNFGTAAGTIAQGNDSRLSNARTPLAHASTHAAAGSDPVTPASIGALNRTNDFMVGASTTTPVLKLQGAAGQTAALQEWRDGSGDLAALITAQGNAFFHEVGVSAPTGGTTVSQFFEVDGLKKFALSATDSVFDVVRYDNAGAFLDRPLRVFRNGKIETTVSMKVADAAIGSGALGLTGNYMELQGVGAPPNPTSGFGRLFLNSATGEVSVKKSSGTVVSLEQGGGIGGPVSSTDNALPRFDGGGDTLQGSGVTVDDSNNLNVPGSITTGSGSTPFNVTAYTDDAAPSAPGTANQFTAYVDRASGCWSWIINGGTAKCALTSDQIDTFAELDAIVADKSLVNASDTQTLTGKTVDGDANSVRMLTHATDCTGVTASGAGELCVELDEGTVYAYNGSTWNQVGSGGASCAFDSGLRPISAGNDSLAPGALWGTESAEGMHGESKRGEIIVSELNTTDAPAIGTVLSSCYQTDSALTVYVYSVRGNGGSTGTALWDVDYACYGDNDGAAGALTDTGTDIVSDWSSYANNDLAIQSQTFTPSGCAANELVLVRVTFIMDTLQSGHEPFLVGLRITN